MRDAVQVLKLEFAVLPVIVTLARMHVCVHIMGKKVKLLSFNRSSVCEKIRNSHTCFVT